MDEHEPEPPTTTDGDHDDLEAEAPFVVEWDDHWNEPEPCPECGKEDRQCPVCS